MTREEKITELKAQIAGLEAQPWLKDGDTIFVLLNCGEVRAACYAERWYGPIFKQGNLFRTLKAAERERDRRAVMFELKKLANGFVPDWNDLDQIKWYIVHNHDENAWECMSSLCTQRIGNTYFKSEAECLNAMNVLGVRLNCLLGV